MDENVTPIGARLGSQRLFPDDDPDSFFGNKPTLPKNAVPPNPTAAGPVPTPPAAAGAPPHLTSVASTVLELTGITALAVGGWLILPAVGLIVAGICLILLGVAVGLP